MKMNLMRIVNNKLKALQLKMNKMSLVNKKQH
jgi:hypothetical protein